VTDPAVGPVVIRPLVPADLATLSQLERALFGSTAWSPAMLAEEIQGPGRWYIGAAAPAGAGGSLAADELAGYAGLWFDGDDAHVMTIGVAHPRQRTGIGETLLAALVARAGELGARSLLLEVRVDNAPALALYARFGFVQTGRRRGYYQPGNVDAFTMRRALPSATGSAPDTQLRR
jgi:ribosomal-protein-alanine N-acetyltransferase